MTLWWEFMKLMGVLPRHFKIMFAQLSEAEVNLLDFETASQS